MSGGAKIFARWFAGLMIALCALSAACAHEIRPAYLNLKETALGQAAAESCASSVAICRSRLSILLAEGYAVELVEQRRRRSTPRTFPCISA